MSTPLVSILLTHHLPINREYLDACLRSIEAQVGGITAEVILASTYAPEDFPSWVRVVVDDNAPRWVNKINLAAKLAHPQSKYFLVLNDDVILSKTCIAQMVWTMGDNKWVMNPMSQCDNGWLFAAPIILAKEDGTRALDRRFYELKDLEGWEDAVMRYETGLNLLVLPPYVCFYCTMIPRTVWEQVGPLDEGCHSSHDDEDYCMRARMHGIPAVVNMGAFALHFGGRTSSIQDTDADRKKTLDYFNAKWGQNRHV